MKKKGREIVIISGLSGSGKSSALKTLEDAGYFAVDNLPGELFPQLIDLLNHPPKSQQLDRIALGLDARGKTFAQNFKKHLEILRRHHIRFKILFLDCNDGLLLRRFSETRRRHPLAPYGHVSEGILKERTMLHSLRAVSQVIDTSYLNVHQLRSKILSLLKPEPPKKSISVRVISFGYRYGLPLEADLVFDVRFLPNPHFIDRLRSLSGQNRSVSQFVLKQKETRTFLKPLQTLLALLLKNYLKEGKAYVTIAFGCTGGRHRSVAVSEKLAKDLKRLGYTVTMLHRDIHRKD
jgi:UPF0042 nucleotide-binding protein